LGNVKERDIDLGGRIILNWNFETQVASFMSGFIWLRIGISSNTFAIGNELSDSKNFGI
jgi:hypothetical protein